MCNTCGCGGGETRIEGERPGEHWHRHEDGTWHSHAHTTGAPGSVFAGLHAAHAGATSSARRVQVEQDLLADNDRHAAANRAYLAERAMFALNLVSSPGSGKTTLLVRTIEALAARVPVVVIEGDQQTTRDAERIRATGAPALQINTGKGCHLDAQMVGRALHQLEPADGSLLLIENVGNLVCPAAFDLGEAHKVVILSVTEGEDKPLKYPDMFRASALMLLNKIDLLPHLDFDAGAALDYAHRVRPELRMLRVSAKSGEGFAEWIDWLLDGVRRARESRDARLATPRHHAAAPGHAPARC